MPRPVEVAATSPEGNDVAPGWISEPLSWQKLVAIEKWLGTEGPYSTPLWRLEGELVLNLGRLEFARREMVDLKTAADAELPSRVRTARRGLEVVMADIDATGAQRRRAQDGIRRADRLLGTSTVPVPSGSVPVIARATWGALKPHLDRMEKTQGAYTRITVHHSADPNPVELDGTSARTYEAMREIQKAHMDGKTTQYGDIGYHFVIDPYGRLLEGRDIAYQGAHAYGDNNILNIGICLIGNFDKERPTKAALETLQRELDTLRQRYDIPKTRVYGHRELRSTECPGENLMRWVQTYRGGTVNASAPLKATSSNRKSSPAKSTRTVIPPLH